MPPSSTPPRVLVIGAGLAGAAAAHALAQAGLKVELCEKSRGAGGRMSTRRHPSGGFDHGAQTFGVRDPNFQAQLALWEAAGAVTPWRGALARFDGQWHAAPAERTRWVATPTMNALPKGLIGELTLHTQTRVRALQSDGEGWRVVSQTGDLGVYDQVILTAPAPQALDILGAEHPFAADLSRVRYAPCWAAMVHGPAGLDVDAVRITQGPLAWASRQDTLPGRTPGERWTLHASPEWSSKHLERDSAWVASALGEAFQVLTQRAWPELSVHRWRYSLVTQAIGRAHLHHRGLYYAGDGCLGGRVESAWRSGVSAAAALLGEAP